MRLFTKMTGLAIAEFMLAAVAVYVATLVRFGGELPPEPERPLLLLRALAFAAVVVVSLTAMGLYQMRQRFKTEGVLVRIALGLVFAGVGLSVVYFVQPSLALWRGWWALSFLFALLFLVGSRYVFAKVVDQDTFRRRVVVYGAGKRASALLELRRRSDQRGFRLLAFMPVPTDPLVVQDERVDASCSNLLDFARKYDAEEIVIAMDDRRLSFPIHELLDCKFAGVNVIDVLAFLERESGKVKVDLLDPSWMIFSEGFTLRGGRGAAVFRMFDLTLSIAVLVVSLPVMLLVALAIFVEDGLPVFYRQTRVGLLGRPFELLKFRSMRKDAEQPGEAKWATVNDSRVTRVGALIRKLRLDELPQLFNVIRGDMRLIGPRPERPEFVKRLAARIPYYHERHCVKPGLTGWAQLSYPYGSSEKDALEKLQFDLYYVKNQSFVFDLMILLQTVEVVIWGKGAR